MILETFEALYHKHYRQLTGIAARMVDDKDDIKDILQEVFASYYEKTEISKQTILQPHSWLIRATLNKCIDHFGKSRKHVKLDLLAYEEPGETASQEEAIDQNKRSRILQEAMRELSAREIKLVVLYSKSFSYKEMAEITGINYTSIGKSLSRTLQKLKQIVKQKGYELY